VKYPAENVGMLANLTTNYGQSDLDQFQLGNERDGLILQMSGARLSSKKTVPFFLSLFSPQTAASLIWINLG